MNILFACGGTAGHINPAVSLARLFEEEQKGCRILFVGADGGMETRLVPKEGYQIRTVTISGFRRSLSPAAIGHDLRTVYHLVKSAGQAKAILKDFRPDLVVGTGGYASYPIVKAAAKAGIPTAVHESNALPGLTTRELAKVVDRVMVGFEESRKYYGDPNKVVVTGTPVRGDFFRYTRKEARAKLGLDDERPLLLSYWGSLGAEAMDGQMAEFIRMELEEGEPFHHIHGAGRDHEGLKRTLAQAGICLQEGGAIQVREYIYDMNVVMAAADVVICRSGASTVSELAALCKPSILVPSPNVTADHQTRNAQVLERAGGAILLPEKTCTPRELYRRASALLRDPEERGRMARALGSMAAPDASRQIYEVLLSLLPH